MNGTVRYRFLCTVSARYMIFDVHGTCTVHCGSAWYFHVSVVWYVRYARYIYGTNKYCTVHAWYIEYRSVPLDSPSATGAMTPTESHPAHRLPRPLCIRNHLPTNGTSYAIRCIRGMEPLPSSPSPFTKITGTNNYQFTAKSLATLGCDVLEGDWSIDTAGWDAMYLFSGYAQCPSCRHWRVWKAGAPRSKPSVQIKFRAPAAHSSIKDLDLISATFGYDNLVSALWASGVGILRRGFIR
ncbi:hypothetical protein BDQ17DRAFT_1334729 [Cyathus striatus]|nr:hypothetical protein BDQ17DRAFT_1334729 [Cyathus striatus]